MWIWCLEKFRAQWYDEYLLSPRERTHGRSRMPFRNRLKVEKEVLINCPLKPRSFEVLDGVVEVISGRDGVVRATRIK